MTSRSFALAAAALLAIATTSPIASADEFAPFGKGKTDMHPMDVTNVVFDANYQDPAQLNILYNFVKNTLKETKGKAVVVTHGPELRAFARENYEKYAGIVDKMNELAKMGVEFKMCNNAMKAAGYTSAEDMHGFVTVVPAGFPELAYWQSKGYQYINPLPYPVKDVRYLDQPQLKKAN